MKSTWKVAIPVTTLLISLIFIASIAWLKFSPPELIRVGANYTAKIVCTNVFLVGREPGEVLKIDVQALGHPLLRLMQIDVDRAQGTVRANIFGLFGRGLAVYRPGTGCAAVPDGDIETAKKYQFAASKIPAPAHDKPWPTGTKEERNVDIEQILNDDQLAGPGMRAIAVVHNGKLIAQRYGKNFNERTPLLGWSMTKTVTAVLVGIQVGNGKLALSQSGFWPPSSGGKEKITLAHLLSMTSGLEFNENYGDVSDVTRMLYLTSDMSAFAMNKPLLYPSGTYWDYSTGTSVVLARLWQNTVEKNALAFPYNALFAPLGMSSAFMEADARGNFVGGSYMYATAQDWARFGQFLLQDGMWAGHQLLPPDFVEMMHSVEPASHGAYGLGQVWLHAPHQNNAAEPKIDSASQLPGDAYWMEGHDGQTITIIPSLQLVVVRLGLTPYKMNYRPQELVAKIINKLH